MASQHAELAANSPTPRDAKRFFAARIIEQAEKEGTALTAPELRFLNFHFEDQATWEALPLGAIGADYFSYQGRLSDLLSRAIAAAEADPANGVLALQEYKANWRALSEPWFKSMFSSPGHASRRSRLRRVWGELNPDAFLYDVVRRGVGRDRRFWSFADWAAAIFAGVSLIAVLGLLGLAAVLSLEK